MYKRMTEICMMCVLTVALCTGCGNNTQRTDNTIPPATEIKIEMSNFIQDNTLLNKNFVAVCDAVGIDMNQILNFEQVDDWAAGPRYTFIYEKAQFVLYCNTDSTVQALQIGRETDIFKQGLEAYQVSDFIATDDEKITLQIYGEDIVRAHLNHPDTADFHTMDWRFGKNHDLYTVSGNVTAENSFGVKDELHFTVSYHVQDGQMTPVYLSVGDNILLNHLEQYPQSERAKAEDFQECSAGQTELEGIILQDGEIGEFGKEEEIGGEIYIDYYIPAGTYTVKNLAASCMVFVIENDSNEPVLTLNLEPDGENRFSIADTQHLELTIYAKVLLTQEENLDS